MVVHLFSCPRCLCFANVVHVMQIKTAQQKSCRLQNFGWKTVFSSKYLSKTSLMLFASASRLSTTVSKPSIPSLFLQAFRKMSSENLPSFETLALTRPSDFVVQVELNRPDKRNALNFQLWKDLGDCFDKLKADEDCRAVVLSGAGKTFCAGLDFGGMAELAQANFDENLDVSRKGFKLIDIVRRCQQGFTAIEKCPKPVIAAIHGGCIGGGTSLVTACDIRYATDDAFFEIKEVDIGLQADVGVLQRMQKQTGNDSLMRELALTARRFHAQEALRIGLISRIFPTGTELQAGAMDLARLIASKSPVAVQGSKVNMNYARDHSVDEGLEFAAMWNMCHLQGEDLVKSAMAAASRQKEPVVYAKL